MIIDKSLPYNPDLVTEKFTVETKSFWCFAISIELFLVVRYSLKV